MCMQQKTWVGLRSTSNTNRKTQNPAM